MLQRILVIILFFLPTLINAQYTPEIDSLIDITSKMEDDSNKVKNLNDLCWELRYKNFDLANQYGKDATNIAEQIEFKLGEAMAYKNLGGINYLHNNYTASFDYYNLSLDIFEEIGDTLNEARVIRNIGSIFHQQGNYEEAIKYFQQSLEMRQIIRDKKGTASVYNGIGLVYFEQGEKMYEKAIEYYHKSLDIYLELNDKKGQAQSYLRIGSLYLEKEDTTHAYGLDYFLKSLELGEQLEDKRLIAQVSDAIGVIYNNKNDDEKAKEYLQKSLDISTEIQNDFAIANTYNNFGDYYLNIGKDDLALKYYNQAIEIAKEIEAPIIERNAYKGLFILYENAKNYKKALEYNKLYIEKDTSIQSAEISKKITQFEMQLEFDKVIKERELEEQRLELETAGKLKRQKLISNFAFLGLFLMLFLALVVFRSYRNKKKANILLKDKNERILLQNSQLNQQKEEITAQRDEIEAQKDILEEKNIKITEQQRNITASIKYALRIQSAILPPVELLDQAFANYFVFYKPRDIVSGDFYWAAKYRNLCLIAAVDCTGHGVPGAFMSMLGISFLNEIITKNTNKNLSAANILEELRTYVKTSLRQTGKEDEAKDGMDMALCSFDFQNKKLQYAGAQNPLILIRENEIIQFKADRMPIGIHILEKDFTNKEIDIRENDMFYMFSDGYADQFGSLDYKKYMIKKFKEFLLKISNLSLDKQKEELGNELHRWTNPTDNISYEQLDDILVIGIRT